MIQVIKRDGKEAAFDKEKIIVAIEKAMHSSTGVYTPGLALQIANEIEAYAEKMGRNITIYAIEDQVYYKLLENNNPATARAYENYKAVQAFKRVENTKDKEEFSLLNK